MEDQLHGGKKVSLELSSISYTVYDIHAFLFASAAISRAKCSSPPRRTPRGSSPRASSSTCFSRR
jgi:hypothetical protein